MAARVLLNNGKEASGFERVIELLSAGLEGRAEAREATSQADQGAGQPDQGAVVVINELEFELLKIVNRNVDREVLEAGLQRRPVNREELRIQYMTQMIGFLQSHIVKLSIPVFTTVVMLGYMHEGHPKDQPVQRRDQNLGFHVAVHQGFWGVLASLLAALVLVLGVRIVLSRRSQSQHVGKAEEKRAEEMEEGRSEEGRSSAMSKGDANGLQNRRKLKWTDLPKEQPAVVAAALTAVLAKMAGPRAAEVFQVTQVPDDQADENALKAFHAGVLEATLASMKRHPSERDVLERACAVLWAINASPGAAAIRDKSRDAIPLLFAALYSFGNEPDVVEAGLTAMDNLIYKNDVNKDAVMAARAKLYNGEEASGVKRVMELLKEGVKVGNAGMQESAVKVLRKLANAGPLSQAGPLRRQRLEDMNVDACVSEAMKQPRASDSFKKDGQMLRNRLRK